MHEKRREAEPPSDAGPPPTVGEVVGENLRRLRLAWRWTQDTAAREIGPPWNRTHIAALESGRRETVDIGTLLMLAGTFDVPVAELFQGDGDVLLTVRTQAADYGRTATRAQLREWLGDTVPTPMIAGKKATTALLDQVHHKGRPIPVEADEALAARLGRPLAHVVQAAEGLWGRSLTEERDRRVAELGDLPIGERQARQGHITRELSSTLQQWIEEGTDRTDG